METATRKLDNVSCTKQGMSEEMNDFPPGNVFHCVPGWSEVGEIKEENREQAESMTRKVVDAVFSKNGRFTISAATNAPKEQSGYLPVLGLDMDPITIKTDE